MFVWWCRQAPDHPMRKHHHRNLRQKLSRVWRQRISKSDTDRRQRLGPLLVQFMLSFIYVTIVLRGLCSSRFQLHLLRVYELDCLLAVFVHYIQSLYSITVFSHCMQLWYLIICVRLLYAVNLLDHCIRSRYSFILFDDSIQSLYSIIVFYHCIRPM